MEQQNGKRLMIIGLQITLLVKAIHHCDDLSIYTLFLSFDGLLYI